MVDKSSEHLYKSKLNFRILEEQNLTRSVLASHSDWGRICWQDMSAEPLPEEPAAEDAGPNDWRRVRDEERDDEGRRDGQSAALGHGRPGEVQGDYGGSLPQGAWLPNSVRHHESEDVSELEVLADDAAGLGRAGHLHHARRQQARPGRGGPPRTPGLTARSDAAVQLVRSIDDVHGDVNGDECQSAERLSGSALGDLCAPSGQPARISARRSKDQQV